MKIHTFIGKSLSVDAAIKDAHARLEIWKSTDPTGGDRTSDWNSNKYELISISTSMCYNGTVYVFTITVGVKRRVN